MMSNWLEPVPEYSKVRKEVFEKYHRKVDAIIQNIRSNSLSEKDKKKLFRELKEKFLNQSLSKQI